ncbi:MAG: DUF302 domain-containing protein [Bacillota bacterium]
MDYHYTVTTDKSFDQALQDLEANLGEARFGVLWALDVPVKLQEKGVDFHQPYRILEVCNPVKAKQALETDPMVGYFLPCKLTVYIRDGKTVLGMVRPTMVAEVVGNPGLRDFAAEVDGMLREVLDRSR